MVEEIFDLYTIDREPLGKTAKRGSVLPENEYHLVVMAIMINRDGKILLTKRSREKTAPGKWECTAGSVIAGENSKEAVYREIREEIGIRPLIKDDFPVSQFIENDAIFDIWKAEINSEIEELKLQEDEVDEARFATIGEIKEIIKKDKATKSLEEVVKAYESGKIRVIE